MTLEERFREIVKLLERKGIRFSVAGGLAASVYRDQPRATADLDFLLATEDRPAETAEAILREAGLHAAVARKADLEGGPMFARKRGSTPPVLVVGRNKEKEFLIGVDFILPGMPWFTPALERSEIHRIDFGFGPIPCLTIEDLIVAKLYALKNDSKRLKDLDDLQSIFRRKPELDILYLSGRMRALALPFPKDFEPDLPETLRKISKSVRRKRPS